MNKKTSSKTIRIQYKIEPDHHPDYVNGANGSILPGGDIVLNFYLERYAYPEHQVIEPNQEKEKETYSSSNGDPEERIMVREVASGVIMSLGTAKQLQGMLSQFIRQLEASIDE